MAGKRTFSILIALLVMASLLMSPTSQAIAKDPPPPTGNGQTDPKKDKITPKDRQDAAARAEAAGFALPEMGAAQMAMPGDAPHYFSMPNYANSPLRLPDALVSFTGDGSGAEAAATVDVQDGSITAVTVVNGGSGYTSAPLVVFSSAVVSTGSGAAATATISGSVTGLALDNGGSGYVEPVTVEFSGGGGTGASATAAVTPLGSVSAINVTAGGSGYTAATVDIAGDGTGATADAVVTLAGPVTALNLTSGGSGYTFANVSFTGDGTGASATATITPVGFVSSINILDGGAGYTTAAVTISGDGAGATAEAVIDPVTGAITAINVTNGGAGYTSAGVVIEGDGTVPALAEAVVDTVTGPITALTLVDGGSGYTSAPAVVIDGDGAGATADAVVDLSSGFVSAINVISGGAGYTAAVVTINGDGTGATADAVVDTTSGAITSLTLVNGGTGYSSAPTVTITGANGSGTGAAATATITGSVATVELTSGGSGYVTPGIRKFVDGLPGLGPQNANNLGQYIPVAEADTTSYPGSDYYEIAVVEYEEQMHSDLPPTRLRGYVQLSTDVIPGASVPLFNPDGSPILLPDGSQALAVDAPHNLGPLISATKDRPVRILFRNLLPTGTGGNLFIPVDTTVMGSGMGPNMGGMTEMDPRNPMCGMDPKPFDCFTENRATLHLHGGISPWISDGTPHQWITPANENTPYPEGVSVQSVPDMPDPGPGAMTFFYTNQQSARLMFYHDHSWGITRLNVYAGEAAAYLITDPTEQSLIDQGILPADQMPLVVQDKTFVPEDWQLAMSDPLWDTHRWGGLGGLWVPHVYSPAQNPGDASGVNQFGRWAYGPWFWPPTSNIDYPPIPNPYYDPTCDPHAQWCEPELMPGVPYLSMGMESFNDTPLVNGTAYPTVTVDPKSYRLRILNAANDRFFNLSLYQADASGTEVALNAAEVAAALEDPAGVFPTPDTNLSPEGPSWIQIGTEGGFLPAPVVIPPHIITWVSDPTVFNAGNVDQHSLLLGPAERADVVVDFSQFAGKTLILYNDAPAAFPARDPRYDYYTGNADLTDTGGAPPTEAGFGPNTRTVMQIVVADIAPAAPFDLGRLEAAFAHQADGSGVFESSQNPIIVGQGEYNSAYGTSFASSGPRAGLVQIYDEYLDFDILAGGTLRMPLERKAIQDEMGEAFEHEYGRMSGNLGVETPNAQAGLQQNLVLYPYVNPATEVMKGVELDGLSVTPITTADDGTQLWKITHNGVDTHPIHFHLFDVQLLNRVGWDGIIRKPDANELGWKDTIRISPLEDTIVALRPIVPKIPFGLLDSIRPLNPMMPLGSPDMFNSTDIDGNPIVPAITNQIVNFGWEYMWHCHILSHEEMDMMRPISVNVNRSLPVPPVVNYSRDAITGVVTLTWADGTPIDYADLNTWAVPGHEVGFRIQRAIIEKNGKVGPYTEIGSKLANQTGFIDTTAILGTNYSYRVVAYNASGDSASAPVGGPVVPPPAAPTDISAIPQAGPQIVVTWRDNANNEAYFMVERSVNGGPFYLIATPPERKTTGSTSITDQNIYAGNTYQYRVAAVNSGGASAFIVSGLVTVVSPPAAPSSLSGTAVRSGKKANITLTWLDNSVDESGFLVERATNASFTVGLTRTNYAANTITASQTGLYRGVTYYFRIRAFNSGGSSAWSNVFSIVTP